MTLPNRLETVNADLSTTALARALATEFAEVVADCRALEIVVGEVFSNLPQGHLLQKLQAFDLIIQRIDGCAKVLEAVADHAPTAWVATDDIIGGVSLSALASRLSGQAPTEARAPSGEMELW